MKEIITTINMNHGSLFSGIGGFDLAAEWMGWNNIFHCELNPFCRKILNYYWPEAASYEDITKTDFTGYRGTIDIISGGFPCQPFSVAGKRKGTSDTRYLWPEMLRAIREIQPTWIVGENVSGLISWNGGLVFDEVQTDLETEGYEVIPFILPACAVDAPHRRDRIWFIAHAINRYEGPPIRERAKYTKHCSNGINGVTTNTSGTGREERNFTRFTNRPGHSSRFRFKGPTKWDEFPTQSPVCNGDDGLSTRLDFDAVFTGVKKPRKANTVSRWRNESLKAGGNAVVPHLPYQLFKAIEKFIQSSLPR